MYHAAKKKIIKKDWLAFANSCVSAGAGELVVNSVDHEGLMGGMALDAIEALCDQSPVPIIASGGVGSVEDIGYAARAGASAIAVGSFFVYHGPHRAVLVNVPNRSVLSESLI
jgi:cyclase